MTPIVVALLLSLGCLPAIAFGDDPAPEDSPQASVSATRMEDGEASVDPTAAAEGDDHDALASPFTVSVDGSPTTSAHATDGAGGDRLVASAVDLSVPATQEEIDAAQEKVDELQAALDGQTEQLSMGSVGLFAGLYASDPYPYEYIANAPYVEYTDPGAEGDATSLTNFKNAIKIVTAINKIRKSRGLDELSITLELTAIAESDANFSSQYYAHAQQYNVAENLAWNWQTDPDKGVAQAVKQWYDNEKAIWDAARKAIVTDGKTSFTYNGTTYRFDPGDFDLSINEFYAKHSDFFSIVGHYLNIIDPSYTTTGTAICTRGTGMITYAQEFGYANSGYEFTPEAFLSFIEDDYEKPLRAAIEATKQDLDAAKQELADLKATRDIANATVSGVSDQIYAHKALTPEPTVMMGSTTLELGTDYTLSYENNYDVGTAKVHITGAGAYVGEKSVTFKILSNWRRLAGNGRYDTMASIVQEGYSSSEWAVVAYGRNYPDALAAAPLAGLRDCPVILTDKGSLSAQARSELRRLGVRHAYVMGGDAAVSDDVVSEIKAMGIDPQRVAGDTRQSTSVEALRELAQEGSPKCVVVATGYGYADTLSIGPWCYASRIPLLLTGRDGRLTGKQLEAIRACPGITSAVIVGGEAVVSEDVESQLEALGIDSRRLAGSDRYATSAAIARWEIEEWGMGVAHAAVATGRDFPDALAGAALCGRRGSVLLLATDGNRTAIDAAIGPRALQVELGYAFGGEAAVSKGTLSHCEGLTK